MLCSMYGVSAICSFGETTNRWMAAAYIESRRRPSSNTTRSPQALARGRSRMRYTQPASGGCRPRPRESAEPEAAPSHRRTTRRARCRGLRHPSAGAVRPDRHETPARTKSAAPAATDGVRAFRATETPPRLVKFKAPASTYAAPDPISDTASRHQRELCEIENRQAVDVKSNVVSEDRIGDAERDAVPELQPSDPFGAGRQDDHQR